MFFRQMELFIAVHRVQNIVFRCIQVLSCPCSSGVLAQDLADESGLAGATGVPLLAFFHDLSSGFVMYLHVPDYHGVLQGFWV